MRNVAQKQHIDYQLSELEDAEYREDGVNSDDTNCDGELSFDNLEFKQEQENPSTSRNSMEVSLEHSGFLVGIFPI